MLVESDDDNKYGSFISKSEGKIVKNYDFNKFLDQQSYGYG